MKTIKNIQTSIQGDAIGSLVINWDMQFYYDKDKWNANVRQDEVAKINSVEFKLFEKVGFDMTTTVLNDLKLTDLCETLVLDDVMYKEVSEIGIVAGEPMTFEKAPSALFEHAANIAKNHAINELGIKL